MHLLRLHLGQAVTAPTEFTAANDALLARLDEAKRFADGNRRELLKDTVVRALVGDLLTRNRPWILSRVRHEKIRMRLRDSVEDLEAQAVVGRGDVGGLLGAVLRYDYPEYGAAGFTPYLKKVIHNALVQTPKQLRRQERERPLDDDQDGKSWTARCEKSRQPRPEQVAISRELLGVIDAAAERLPANRRWVAKFVLEFTKDNARAPTGAEVGEQIGAKKQWGDQLLIDTFEKLQVEIGEMCPDLAKGGIGGLAEFRKVFGKHKGAVGVGR
jgi:hypothetical protein